MVGFSCLVFIEIIVFKCDGCVGCLGELVGDVFVEFELVGIIYLGDFIVRNLVCRIC